MAGKHRKVDVAPDVRKARSRIIRSQSHGGHVGLTSPDDALDVGETGADARDAQR